MNSFKQDMAKLGKSSNNKKVVFDQKKFNLKIWNKFCNVNNQIIYFFYQLRICNRYWSPLASIYFLGHTSYIVADLHGLLVDRSKGFNFKKIYFVFFTVELTSIMLLITNECAKIVRNNVQIYKTNRQFAYQRTFQRLNVLHQIKVYIYQVNFR